ncbi:MAG: hypothetical protein H0W76_24375 [Pyrinomonadaceae bacterium]|nr:hypothetical protein [Pyrinomonadaceae bacterium]
MMAFKRASIALITLVVTVTVLVFATRNSSVKAFFTLQSSAVTVEEGTLLYYAHVAQSNNLGEYNISAGVADFPLPSWDDAIANSNIVRARLLDSRSYPIGYEVNGNYADRGIVTWHKFKILEWWRQSPSCMGCGDGYEVPADMLPLNSDEVLVQMPQGTLFYDGVLLRSTDHNWAGYEFTTGAREYVIFFQRDASGLVARLWLGPNSVYGYALYQDGTPYNDDFGPAVQPSSYSDEIQRRYGGSRSQFRASL